MNIQLRKLSPHSKEIPGFSLPERQVFEGRGGEVFVLEKSDREPTYFNRRRNPDGTSTIQFYCASHNRVLVTQTTEDPTKLKAHYWYHQVSTRGRVANRYAEFDERIPLEEQDEILDLRKGDLTPQRKKELEAVIAAAA